MSPCCSSVCDLLDTLSSDGQLLNCHLVLDKGAEQVLDSIGGFKASVEWGFAGISSLDASVNQDPLMRIWEPVPAQQLVRFMFIVTGFLWDAEDRIISFVKQFEDCSTEDDEPVWARVHVISGLSAGLHSLHTSGALDFHAFGMRLQAKCMPVATEVRVSHAQMLLVNAPATNINISTTSEHIHIQDSVQTTPRLQVLTVSCPAIASFFPLMLSSLATAAARSTNALDRLAHTGSGMITSESPHGRYLELAHVSEMEAQTMLSTEQRNSVKLVAQGLGEALRDMGMHGVTENSFAAGYTSTLIGNVMVGHLRNSANVGRGRAGSAEQTHGSGDDQKQQWGKVSVLLLDRCLDVVTPTSHSDECVLAAILACTHTQDTRDTSNAGDDIFISHNRWRQIRRQIGSGSLRDLAQFPGLDLVSLSTMSCNDAVARVHVMAWAACKHVVSVCGFDVSLLPSELAPSEGHANVRTGGRTSGDEDKVLELLEWLVETCTDTRTPGVLSAHVACSLQGTAMHCGVLPQFQIVAMVCCAVSETREAWVSMDRLERMQDKLASHQQWTHTSHLAELLRDSTKQASLTPKPLGDVIDEHAAGVRRLEDMLQQIFRTYSLLGLSISDAEESMGGNEVHDALVEHLGGYPASVLRELGLLAKSAEVSPSYLRLAATEVHARLLEISRIRQHLWADEVKKPDGYASSKQSRNRDQQNQNAGIECTIPSGTLAAEDSQASLLLRILSAGLCKNTKVNELRRVGPSALEQVAKAGMSLLKSGLGAFGFRSSASRDAESSGGRGAGDNYAAANDWASADTLVVVMIGGVSAQEIGIVSQVLDRAESMSKTGDGGCGHVPKKVVLVGSSLTNGAQLTRTLLKGAYVDLGRRRR